MISLNRLSSLILGNLEKFFCWWGGVVTRWPFVIIATCAVVTGLAAVGFLQFSQENRADRLWIPESSEYNTHQRWVDENFKKNERSEIVIFKSENILTPEALKKMLELYQKVDKINVGGKTFSHICTRVSIADIFQTKRKRRRKREAEHEFNETEVKVDSYDDDEYYDFWAEEYDEYKDVTPVLYETERIDFKKYGRRNRTKSSASDVADDLPRNVYCDLVTTLNSKCVMTSLLEMFRYDEDNIRTTTTQEILRAVNELERSPWFGYDRDFSSLLGGIKRNASGHIISARTALMVWSVTVPDDAVIDTNQGSGVELELADADTLEWERVMIDTVLEMREGEDDLEILPNAARSYGDISSGAISSDLILLFGGYLMMFVYTVLMLGKINSVEVRLFLAVAGMVSIGMGISIAISLSSLLGFFWTPMHPALPLLCLGIGIDDMFVIMQSLSNVKRSPATSYLPPDQQIAEALKHAGVAVTVTSVTDVFAFACGAVTNMPGLQSFCVAVAIGLGSIYILQVTWFAAWLSLDEKRIETGRNGLIPCIVHQSYSPGSSTSENIVDKFKSFYSKLLGSAFYKTVIILISLTCLGFGIYGWIEIKQIFYPFLLMPSDSYLRQWIRTHKENYPDEGWVADVYSGQVRFSDLETIDDLVTGLKRLEAEGEYLRAVDSWWPEMKRYSEQKTNFSSWREFANKENFSMVLSDFLFSSHGARYKSSFKFAGDLKCGAPAPAILTTRFTISYVTLTTPDEHIPARNAVNRVIEEARSPYNFSHVKIYASWETDIIIGSELWRNLGLSITAVVIITFLLLCNVQICLMVVLMVTISLADIIGFLHFWNITIDIISCINIVLSVGLCVDYSVHIGHAFLVARGSRQERTVEAVMTIGPAVLNGGFTTSLALALCYFSTGHVLLTFFKVFMLTVAFGLFHGVILLPVILSIFGPDENLDWESNSTPNITVEQNPKHLKKDMDIGIEKIEAHQTSKGI